MLSAQAFVTAMPRVRPFYAVKCNPNPVIMRSLAALGCGFDCASAKEMADVLSMGVHPSRVIFAHPCKRPADLLHAAATSVTVRSLGPLDDQMFLVCDAWAACFGCMLLTLLAVLA
jgi:ornithine decarboxylase